MNGMMYMPDSQEGDEQPIRLPEWRELYDDALSWPYDQVIPHAYIEKILGVSRTEGSKYYNRVNRAIRELMRDRRHVVNVADQGYMLIRPHEVIGRHVDRLAEKADRVMCRTVETLITVDADQLDPADQTIWRFKLDRTMFARSVTRQTKVDLIARARDAPKLALSPAREGNDENKEDYI